MPQDRSSVSLLHRLRLLLLSLVLFGALGLIAELALMEHWEAAAQRIPLALLVLTAVGAGAVLLRPTRFNVRAFQGVLVLAVLSGVVGSLLHYQGNAALEEEINPDRPAGELVKAALTGGVPTLAPGAMIQLGLLGLIAVYRHPGATAVRDTP